MMLCPNLGCCLSVCFEELRKITKNRKIVRLWTRILTYEAGMVPTKLQHSVKYVITVINISPNVQRQTLV
jgi:hypothetical protein